MGSCEQSSPLLTFNLLTSFPKCARFSCLLLFREQSIQAKASGTTKKVPLVEAKGGHLETRVAKTKSEKGRDNTAD